MVHVAVSVVKLLKGPHNATVQYSSSFVVLIM